MRENWSTFNIIGFRFLLFHGNIYYLTHAHKTHSNLFKIPWSAMRKWPTQLVQHTHRLQSECLWTGFTLFTILISQQLFKYSFPALFFDVNKAKEKIWPQHSSLRASSLFGSPTLSLLEPKINLARDPKSPAWDPNRELARRLPT